MDLDQQKPFFERWDNATQAIDSALDRLHFLAAAIRKASAKRLEYNAANFLADEDIVFRRYAVILVQRRFPAARKGLCKQLGDALTIRRRMLLQSNNHAKKLTVRRAPQTLISAPADQSLQPQSSLNESRSAGQKWDHNQNIKHSGKTKASRPDPEASVLKGLHLPARPAPTTAFSTIPITTADPFEYPPPPKVKLGETRIQCPYCLKPLDTEVLQDKGNQYWTHHVDEDLKPYTCLFPECADALVFFTRRHEWVTHMEKTHSRDWLRRVHTVIWLCDIGHDPPEQFETEGNWRKHMENLDLHSQFGLSRTKPTKAQLDALSPRKKQVALRQLHTCPLCEQIPEKLRPLVEDHKVEDLYEVLVEHVASHIKSLALVSLPVVEVTTPATDTASNISMQESSRHILHDQSVPQPPSGLEYLEILSLPAEDWPMLGSDHIATLHRASQNLDSIWDQDFHDYKYPEVPPDTTDFQWLKTWKVWNAARVSYKSTASDSVLTTFRRDAAQSPLTLYAAEDESDLNHFKLLEGHLEIGKVQALIICAKKLEVDAVLATFDKRYKEKTMVKKLYLFAGTFKEINVAIFPLFQQRMVVSTTDTIQVVSELRLDACIISAGICGGTGCDDDEKQAVYLGDVVISTDVARYFDYIQGKDVVKSMLDQGFGGQRLKRLINILKMGDELVQLRRDADENLQEVRRKISSGFFGVGSFTGLSTNPPDGRIHQDRLYKEDRPHMHQESKACTSQTQACSKETKASCLESRELSCEQTGCNKLPREELERDPPGERGPLPVHFGIFGREDVTVRSGSYTRASLKSRGIMAIDMESRGILHASGSHNPPRAIVIIRGVADYADSHNNDAWQPYAAMAAACTIKAFVVEFLQSRSHEASIVQPTPTLLIPPHPEPFNVQHSVDTKKCLTAGDYSIAFLCSSASPAMMAAMCMLDDEHLNPQNRCRFPCKFGAIQVNDGDSCHNIVIASVQLGENGSLAMKETVTALKKSFPKLELFLSLGTGEGIPRPTQRTDPERDIHLGDVVVGVPGPSHPALVHYHPPISAVPLGDSFPPSTSQRLPEVPREILEGLKAFLHARPDRKLDLSRTMRRLDRGKGFQRPHPHTDKLHKAGIVCAESQLNPLPCSCAEEDLVSRPSRGIPQDGLVPIFHRGQIICITSPSALLCLDDLASTYPEALCLDTQVAGLPQDCRALVIRGISNYAGTQPKSQWDAHALGAAAAFAREFIRRLPEPVETSGVAHRIRKTYLFDSIGVGRDIYDAREFYDAGHFYLDRTKHIWEQMTVSGIAIYEEIYADCADAEGHVDQSQLKDYFPLGDAQAMFVESRNELVKHAQSSRLDHSMTLALIYMVHLRVWAKVGKTSLEISREDRERRARLRNFAKWVGCNCGDDYCPCLWNFVNSAGLCRNPSPTCQAHRWMCTGVSDKGDYGMGKSKLLRRKWGGKHTDTQGQTV